MNFYQTPGYKTIYTWLASQDRKPFAFQEETWQHIADGQSGLVNAPTGYGKTYSVFLGAIIAFINENPNHFSTKKNNGLQLIWITPLRALAKDIGRAMEEAITAIGLPWQIGIRNGDTTTSERARQKRNMPEIMIITPESLMLLLAMKDNSAFFKTLKIIAVDEWHELIGSKRGVQVELAVSHLVNRELSGGSKIPNNLQVWGISATIGNLEEAKDVLLNPLSQLNTSLKTAIVKANLPKQIDIESIFPDEIEKFPWAGHLGIKLADKLLPIIRGSRTTLIFINTRGMSERWYQTLLDIAPDLAGAIALHHGSIEPELRNWVEDALHQGILKAVVCTASLDLGVDFRPVETVVQVGSPKGVARFLQRAGRSGHQPGAVSKIWFLPTHSLELTEAAALKAAVAEQQIESREPMILCYDVLIQYLCTLAVGEGFRPEIIYPEIKSTFCFSYITDDDWQQILQFLINGGNALQQYDDYKKVIIEDGIYKIISRRMAMRHRMHIGTIVSDSMLKVKFISGGYIGVIEEYFISRLDAGDVFTLAGRNLELVSIKDMTVLVRKSTSKKSIVPSWNGGRMPLSSKLSALLRRKIGEAADLVEENEHDKKKEKDYETSTEAPLSLGEGTGVRSTEENNDGQTEIKQKQIAPKHEKNISHQIQTNPEKSLPNYFTTDPHTWATLLPYAKQMRHEPTEAEAILWQALRNRKLNGYKFRRHHPIEQFIGDLVCIEKKLIVEADGQHHNIPEQKEWDVIRALLLAEKGFRIIRFYNNDIVNNLEAVLIKIANRLEVEESSEEISNRLKHYIKNGLLFEKKSTSNLDELKPLNDKPLNVSATKNLTPTPLQRRGAFDPELLALTPLFELQKQLSHIPRPNELLIEHIETKDGYHLFVYPFEGRLVHEAMSALLAYRIGKLYPMTFSIAMNDYGFELLSDQPIPVDDTNVLELISTENLLADIHASNNSTEMAKRKFRDIAVIGGLIFQGMPGEQKKARHLQSSASLLFKVFAEYDPNNLLLRQAYQEVLFQQMEEVRLRAALQRMTESNIIIKFPERLTPFCFPIKVDSMREAMSSEKLEDRVRKMLANV